MSRILNESLITRESKRQANAALSSFEPVQKLVSKHRDGARGRRVYDRAQTPYQRLGASGILSPATRVDLEALYQRLNPLRLRRELDAELDRLYRDRHPLRAVVAKELSDNGSGNPEL